MLVEDFMHVLFKLRKVIVYDTKWVKVIRHT